MGKLENELEFRKRAYANPYDCSEDFVAALESNPEYRHFVDDLLNFDRKLQDSIDDIPVPDGLAERIILRQSLKQYQRNKPLRAIFSTFAIAASVVLVIGLAATQWPSRNHANFDAEIFAHISNEPVSFANAMTVNAPLVNQLMASFGGQLNDESNFDSMQIQYVRICEVDAHIGMHMVITGSKGSVSIFMLPNPPVRAKYNISNQRFDGIVAPRKSGNLVVVGEKDETIDMYKNLIASNFTW